MRRVGARGARRGDAVRVATALARMSVVVGLAAIAGAGLGCGDRGSGSESTRRGTATSRGAGTSTGTGADPHDPATDVDEHADPAQPDETTHASDDVAPEAHGGGAPDTTDELGVAALVARNRARMTRERSAPVHVVESRDPRQAGRAICEATVPRRPPETPVLLKPNLAGINILRDQIDQGIELRTTGIDFLRGVIDCLKARGHREITITEVWSRDDQRDWWMRATGLDRLLEEEGVQFVGLFDERGPDGTLEPTLAAPMPDARALTTGLRVPRVLARHLRDGLYITIPRMKMHRFAVMTLSIKNAMGVVVTEGATPPRNGAGALHREFGTWLERHRHGQDDRDLYVSSLERFAERIVDVLELELPDAALIDGVPPVAGDGFALIEPLDAGVAIGSTNPVYADAVAMEWMGYLDNADLAREIRHPTSPLLEEAARRFWGTTDVLRGVRIEGDASFRREPRPVAHYRAFPGFEIGTPPSPMGALPWIARAVTAKRAREAPAIDGALDDDAWRAATPVQIRTDYAGAPAPNGLDTEARLLWTDDALYVAFDCAYDELVVDDAAPADTEHERLYQFDALEIFLDDSPRSHATYREIELGPRGHVLDVNVNRDARPRGDVAWSSGVERATHVDEVSKRFTIEARIPASAFGRERLAPDEWRIALYRIAGRTPHRTHIAAFPTFTERPNFHVPERFGWLRLVR